MNILDKLKKLNKSLIYSASLRKVLEEALANYANKENLMEKEVENYNKIYDLVETHFPEAAGIAPKRPDINADDLLNNLKKNKPATNKGVLKN